MQTARTASIAFLALIFPVAALVFPIGTRAASGNVQVCQPSSSCQVGEFLYNDSYSPITSATCTITSRYPDGSLFLNASSLTASSQNDGWYYKDFTAPSTSGLYRTQVCCTSGSEYLCLDKTFEVKEEANTSNVASAVWNASKSSYTTSGTFGGALQNSVPSTSDIASATWGYSSRSLSTFGTLVADVWGYSTRNLTGFGDLVANIWGSNTRSLTDLYIPGSTTSITNVSNVTNEISNIQNITNETRSLLEQVINKPVMESSLEAGTGTFNLESKIDDTQKTADQLSSKIKYLRSKAGLVDSKWDSLKPQQISKILSDMSFSIGSEKDITNKSSVLGASTWIGEQWDWQEAAAVTPQSKALNSKVLILQTEIENKGKSAKARKDIKAIIASADKIQALIGNSLSISKTKTVNSRINEVRTIAKTYDSKTLELGKIYSSVSQGQSGGFEAQVQQLAKDIAQLNFIPKIQKNILAKADSGEKGFKNKILSLLGMVDANKKFLAKKPEDTLTSTWLELGSIIFKTLITNPSQKITQQVPVKYYLPKEIKRENILNIDKELTVNFDAEKDQYYVAGNFELKPSESRTLSIHIDDSVYAFNEQELGGIKKQAEELSQPLKNTSYFAQGATLKSDIDVSINKILSLQKAANTPEEKIRAYREGDILLDATSEKMDKLKEIATSAGSVNTLFGFVGGAQVLAVWGLVIILVTGFVFLALYLKMIKNSSNPEVKKVRKQSFDEEFEQEQRIKKGSRGFKLAAIAVIAIVGIGLAGGFGLMQIRNSQQKQVGEQIVDAKINGSQAQKTVLGEATASAQLPESLKGEEVNLFVPEDSSVSIFKEPSLDSDVLANLESPRKVLQIGSQDGWVRIAFDSSASEKIAGWVDADFIERKAVKEAEASPKPSAPLKLITISDTPTGFLRVRSAPGGKELGKLDPGKKYPVLDSKLGWLNILLDDGTSGWVSGKYTDINGTGAIGGQIKP